MITAVMQPYFLPYIGYFQLIAAADTFVLYDNIQYTKKGWVNRNRLLAHGSDKLFSLPLKKDSDFVNVADKCLADTFNREKLLNQFKGNYQTAPFFDEVLNVLESIISFEEPNLFKYIRNSLVVILDYLEINTEIIPSSEVPADHSLSGQNRVIAICNAIQATTYLNPVGGKHLYSAESFSDEGIQLQYLQPTLFDYPHFGAPFVPHLSIIDVLMFNSPHQSRHLIDTKYEIR